MRTFGSTIYRFDSLPSTNDFAREMALKGCAEGTLVFAGQQTAGRGRQGRSWSSPPGEGLYISLILRPSMRAAEATVITLAAAVGVREVLAEEYGLECDIKWPNDLTVRDKKVCGILMESASEGEYLRYAVLGVGINLLQRGFPIEIAETATSLFTESGISVKPQEIVRPLLDRLERVYILATQSPHLVLSRWTELSSYSKGARVHLIAGDGVVNGITRGITNTGALLIETEDGKQRAVAAGQVSLKKVAKEGPGVN